MKKLLLGLVICTNFASAKSTGGGNGGDILKCEENGSVVYRTLDSVITKDQPFFERMNYNTYSEALESILNHFDKTLPLMKLKLQDFLTTYKNKRNEKGNIFWLKSKLKQVDDENLYVVIPNYCDENPIQTVTLVKEGLKRYYYDPSQLEKIESVDDELSWMLIHEFLRDFIEDSDIIRIVNAYIHSSDFLNDDENGVKDQLHRLGLSDTIGETYSDYQEDILVAKKILSIMYKKEIELAKIKKSDIAEFSRREKKELINKLVTLKIPTSHMFRVSVVAIFMDINQIDFYKMVHQHNQNIENLLFEIKK